MEPSETKGNQRDQATSSKNRVNPHPPSQSSYAALGGLVGIYKEHINLSNNIQFIQETSTRLVSVESIQTIKATYVRILDRKVSRRIPERSVPLPIVIHMYFLTYIYVKCVPLICRLMRQWPATPRDENEHCR